MNDQMRYYIYIKVLNTMFDIAITQEDESSANELRYFIDKYTYLLNNTGRPNW